ncbi:DUF4261 domain-containing protein [Luteolibacter flavescens]|uniref:DUF4261 domain-containing protein n=1 Tax=Luteolibacter flavescens TaxID=1859460 RepID=A0ABT3FR18_9BACT|nr:DUF4261 domain-containing protein [Luteolibacter flavescens]MCW1885649.1 DUF4261 domain-containing protein [Luteolibacter flavescens]
MILCIPGPWADRSEFLKAIITTEPAGQFIFAGGLLAHPSGEDHVPLTYADADPDMAQAFHLAGQGQISDETLEAISAHGGVAYLHFAMDLPEELERIVKFTDVVRRAGGIAVKVESCGVAHEWERWSKLLSGNAFDHYCSACTLIGGEDYFYSCGMHHFGLPECSIPTDFDAEEAAHLINQFNLYQIVSNPHLESGHTVSLSEESIRFRLTLEEDGRHEADDLFHNPHGVWVLTPCE